MARTVYPQSFGREDRLKALPYIHDFLSQFLAIREITFPVIQRFG